MSNKLAPLRDIQRKKGYSSQNSFSVLWYLLIELFSLLTRACEWSSCKFAHCRFMMKSAALVCLKCAFQMFKQVEHKHNWSRAAKKKKRPVTLSNLQCQAFPLTLLFEHGMVPKATCKLSLRYQCRPLYCTRYIPINSS